jgi:hypothetical protein
MRKVRPHVFPVLFPVDMGLQEDCMNYVVNVRPMETLQQR